MAVLLDSIFLLISRGINDGCAIRSQYTVNVDTELDGKSGFIITHLYVFFAPARAKLQTLRKVVNAQLSVLDLGKMSFDVSVFVDPTCSKISRYSLNNAR